MAKRTATGPESVGAKVGDGSGSYGSPPGASGPGGSRYRHPDASGKRATGPESVGIVVGNGANSYGPAVKAYDTGYGRSSHPMNPNGR